MMVDIWGIVNAALVIVGFVVNYFMTRKTFNDEVNKNKIAVATENIKDLPIEIIEMLDPKKMTADKIKSIQTKIFTYGSKDANKIFVTFQRKNYETESSIPPEESFALFGLLITQIKYDLTSEVLSPETWFQISVTDYEKMTKGVKDNINRLVYELKLNKDFCC